MKKYFTKENCCRTMYDDSVETNEGCVAILKPKVLPKADRTADNQLFYLMGGFGCDPKANGNACFGKFCNSGEKTGFERYEFLGIADEETKAYAEELERKREKITAEVYVEYLERKYKEKLILTQKEKEVLVECNQDVLEMYKNLDEVYHTEESNHLRTMQENIQNKLSQELVKISEFNKLELMNLVSCLAHHAELKITVVKNNGLNPKQDKELLFINSLYIKLYKAFSEVWGK